jgi:photosystem II stability/assembly factor-like uncharacterized protein
MKKLFHLLFAFAISATAFPQNFWLQTNGPYGGGDPSIAVQSLIVSEIGHIFAATNTGGVFRSTDGGENWFATSLSIDVFSLALNSNGTIFAGTENGIYFSIDQGENWTSGSIGLTDPNIYSLAINSNDFIFAGTRDSGMFRSTNDGASWIKINNGFTTSTNVLALAISLSNALLAGTGGGGVFRSTNDGESWTTVNTGLPPGGSRAVRAITVDSSGNIFAGTFAGVFRSSNDGTSWTPTAMNLHTRALASNVHSHIFVGTLGGPFRSTDNGENWTGISSGLSDTILRSFAINAVGVIFAGSIGGAVFRSTESTINVKESQSYTFTSYLLEQNYPNPFNPTTVISYELPVVSEVKLSVYNILGKEVTVLVSEPQNAGRYNVEFEASGFPSGLYFYEMRAQQTRSLTDEFVSVKRMILLK